MGHSANPFKGQRPTDQTYIHTPDTQYLETDTYEHSLDFPYFYDCVKCKCL